MTESSNSRLPSDLLQMPSWPALRRLYSTKSYSKSLLLPKTSFPLWSKPEVSEEPFRPKTTDGLYKWQKSRVERPVYSLHDGPPYANGDLHMGHALNKILKDIINRFHLSTGKRIEYRPGWDCHGLPIENKALKDIKKDSQELSPPVIRQVAEATAEREVANQRAQFEQLGVMADWSEEGTYRTMDHDYEIRQLRVFQKMVERGLIYRKYRPVHFSPSSRSALAEAELVYKDDHVSHSVYVSFDLVPDALAEYPNAQLLVWTTTPWTLSANMFIAVNSDLQYLVVRKPDSDSQWVIEENRLEALQEIFGPLETCGSLPGTALVGLSYKPIFGHGEPRKIVHGAHVTSDSGTGLVHSAPAHGFEDYNAYTGKEPILCHVDGKGQFTQDIEEVVGPEVARQLVGKPVLGDGSKAVVQVLGDRVQRVQRIKHRYPYDWKTDKPIIVTATSQWFADLSDIKPQALDALEGVQFVPAGSRNRLESFVKSRSEWCISRQRVWGIPIPSLHNKTTGEAILDTTSLDHILSVLSEKGVAHWWTGPVSEFLPPPLASQADNYEKGTDTMDVWFDSGTSWSMNEDKKPVADVCLEGTDQHRGWFQSQLLTKLGSGGETAPYKTLITHGMVLDQEGKKMSKSLGNIVSPMVVIRGGKDKKRDPPMGADVLRLWAATIEYWRDASIGPTALQQTRESMKRIRNSARFILGNIGHSEWLAETIKSESLIDRSVLNDLYKLEQTALEGYQTFNFPKVMTSLVNFFNGLSSIYFDIHKDCLYANSIDDPRRMQVVDTLKQILYTTTRIAAPVLPHFAEEVHYTLTGSSESFFQTPWTPMDKSHLDPRAEEDMAELMRIRHVVLGLLENARSDGRIGSSLEAQVDLLIPQDSPIPELLAREEDFLKTLFIVSDVTLTSEGSLGTDAPAWVYTQSADELGVRVRPAELYKCPRCWTFAKSEEEVLCGRCHAAVSH